MYQATLKQNKFQHMTPRRFRDLLWNKYRIDTDRVPVIFSNDNPFAHGILLYQDTAHMFHLILNTATEHNDFIYQTKTKAYYELYRHLLNILNKN